MARRLVPRPFKTEGKGASGWASGLGVVLAGWRGSSEVYSVFDVDVTTEDPALTGTAATNYITALIGGDGACECVSVAECNSALALWRCLVDGDRVAFEQRKAVELTQAVLVVVGNHNIHGDPFFLLVFLVSQVPQAWTGAAAGSPCAADRPA